MGDSEFVPQSRKSRKITENFTRLLEESEMRVVLAEQERERTEAAAGPVTGSGHPGTNSNAGGSQEKTELTVDLPQGQKLTVKGIEPGTIVEVASWSGKSGPNDGAVRMLFGASDQEDKENPIGESETVEPERITGSIDAVPVNGLTEETGVETVMNPRRADLQRDRGGDLSADLVTEGLWGKIMRRSFVLLGVLGILFGAIFGLRAADILYFEHPQGGLTTGLGGAESSIAAVNPKADISLNSAVIVEIDGELMMVSVAQVGGDQLLVSLGDGQTVVLQKDVVGRVLFVIPFVGHLFETD